MSEVNVTKVTATPEQLAIGKLSEKLFNTAAENAPSYGALFNAFSHTIGTFFFQYLMATQGKVTNENLAEALDGFAADTKSMVLQALETFRATAVAEAGGAS